VSKTADATKKSDLAKSERLIYKDNDLSAEE